MQLQLGRPASFAIAGSTMVAAMAAAAAPSPLYPVYQRLWGFSAFTLTVVFAVYVVALLAALLTVGSVSDHVGRRPVIISGLIVLAVGMVLFANAHGVAGLVVARVVQGLATGAITGTISAMVVDLQPNARFGSIVSSSTPPLGLALGAVLAGALVQHAPAPRQLVFWILFAAYIAFALILLLVPEAAERSGAGRRTVARSLLPSAGVSQPARATFAALVPAICATWALGGLYLSLGSSVVGRLLGVTDHFVVGLVLGAFFAAGALGSFIASRLPQPRRLPFGYATLGTGVALTVVATLNTSLWVYVVGSAAAGLGFGSTFMVAMGTLAAVTPARDRGQTFATTFVVSYAAFSIPALVAGLAVEEWGLRPTVLGYGAFVLALVVAASVAAVVLARRSASRAARESADEERSTAVTS
ncbi:MFS transporter [Calidifontibacter terrae]